MLAPWKDGWWACEDVVDCSGDVETDRFKDLALLDRAEAFARTGKEEPRRKTRARVRFYRLLQLMKDEEDRHAQAMLGLEDIMEDIKREIAG